MVASLTGTADIGPYATDRRPGSVVKPRFGAAHLEAMPDPRIAHQIDGRTLLALLPYVDQSHLPEIRQQFGRFLSSRRGLTHPTWQAAWNDWTGATPHRAGTIEFRPSRCGTCHGRNVTTRNISRNISRTGSPYMCGDCVNGVRPIRQPARYADVPETPLP